MKENVIYEKSFEFSIKVIKTYKVLNSKGEYVISKQLLRSGTSIGANINEAIHAQSRKDFLSKMNISLKEAMETEYWIKLLIATDYLNNKEILNECIGIKKILHSIVKTTKESLKNW